jgi:hypothetical protein
MPSIRVPLTIHESHRWISPLQWEPWCLVCNAPAETESSASLVNPRELVFVPPLLFWSSEHFDVSYPVCTRHRRMCSVLDWPARRGSIMSFISWLALPAIFWLVGVVGVIHFLPQLSAVSRQVLGVSLAIAFWGAMTIWYVAAIFVKPVRLSELRPTHITVTVRNKIAFLHIEAMGFSPSARTPDQDRETLALAPREKPRRKLQFKRGPDRSDLS